VIDPEAPLHTLPPAHRVLRHLHRHSEANREIHQAMVQEAERIAKMREAELPPPAA